jgi:hypothetical protein
MGIARAIQKGEIAAKPGTPSAEIAKSMKPSDVREFASTSQEGLPEKKKKLKMINVGKPVKKFRF